MFSQEFSDSRETKARRREVKEFMGNGWRQRLAAQRRVMSKFSLVPV